MDNRITGVTQPTMVPVPGPNGHGPEIRGQGRAQRDISSEFALHFPSPFPKFGARVALSATSAPNFGKGGGVGSDQARWATTRYSGDSVVGGAEP